MSHLVYTKEQKNRLAIKWGDKVRFNHEDRYGVYRLEGTVVDVWKNSVIIVDLQDDSRYVVDIRDDNAQPVVTA